MPAFKSREDYERWKASQQQSPAGNENATGGARGRSRRPVIVVGALAVAGLLVFGVSRLWTTPAQQGPPPALPRGPEAARPAPAAPAESTVPAADASTRSYTPVPAEELERIARLDMVERVQSLVNLVERPGGVGEEVVPLILPLLQDETPLKRRQLLQGSPPVPPEAVQYVGSSTTPRHEAIQMLGKVGGAAAAAALIDLLPSGGELAKSRHILWALVLTGDPTAIETLCRLLDEQSRKNDEKSLRVVVDVFNSRRPFLPGPPALQMDVIERTRPVWEALARDTGPHSHRLTASSMMEEQVAGLVAILERGGGADRERAHQLLQRVSGERFPADARTWRDWHRRQRCASGADVSRRCTNAS